jgi:hypothetical protein
MVLKKLPEPVSKCSICTINLYHFKDRGINPRPDVFPCGIENCPFEDIQLQSEVDFKRLLEK